MRPDAPPVHAIAWVRPISVEAGLSDKPVDLKLPDDVRVLDYGPFAIAL